MSKTSTEIPEAFQIKETIDQKKYLIDGELKSWSGNTTEVFSTISSTEEYKPTLLGSIPDMGEPEAMDALNAAHKAYGRGQGIWPTMHVKDRIQCMESFVKKMETSKRNLIEL